MDRTGHDMTLLTHLHRWTQPFVGYGGHNPECKWFKIKKMEEGDVRGGQGEAEQSWKGFKTDKKSKYNRRWKRGEKETEERRELRKRRGIMRKKRKRKRKTEESLCEQWEGTQQGIQEEKGCGDVRGGGRVCQKMIRWLEWRSWEQIGRKRRRRLTK